MIRDEKELLEAVREAVGTEYVVFGILGRRKTGPVYLLGRRARDDALTFLALEQLADGGEYSLSEERAPAINAEGSLCGDCREPVRLLAAYCTLCGRPVETVADFDTAILRERNSRPEHRNAVTSEYLFLGEIHQGREAPLRLARDSDSGRIVAVKMLRTKSGRIEEVVTEF